ncbi:hypothetical protein D3C72_1145490 [compost metagenome]
MVEKTIAVELHRHHPVSRVRPLIHRLKLGKVHRTARQIHDARANGTGGGKLFHVLLGRTRIDNDHGAGRFAHLSNTGERVAIIALMGVSLSDDDPVDAEPLHELAIVLRSRQGARRQARPARQGRITGQIQVHLRVDGPFREGGPRRCAAQFSDEFAHGSGILNSSNASRLISIPRPGPSGMATMPFTASIGLLSTAWRKGL